MLDSRIFPQKQPDFSLKSAFFRENPLFFSDNSFSVHTDKTYSRIIFSFLCAGNKFFHEADIKRLTQERKDVIMKYYERMFGGRRDTMSEHDHKKLEELKKMA